MPTGITDITEVFNVAEHDASPADQAFGLLQQALPTHLMSRFIHRITRIEAPWFKNRFIKLFMKGFGIKLDEAQIQNPHSFRHFNDFFTRALIDGARPMPETADVLCSPVDGRIYQTGDIVEGRIFQAKGRHFNAVELLGGDPERSAPFLGGRFATIYLAPSNYHRIHMPLSGSLRETVYIPGRLFSVNPATARAVPNLFARNERVAAIFDTAVGPMAMVLVGALFVGSIETIWAGEITPPHRGKVQTWTHLDNDGQSKVSLARGEEMGRFNMGSTVILLFGPDAVQWAQEMEPDSPIRLGQKLGMLN